MAPADLLARLRTRSFEPFRIVTTDGTCYDIRHPELVVVGLGSAYVFYPAPELAGVMSRLDIVSMRHIRLEELQPQSAEGTAAAESN
jgi:hypothetical protein